MKFILLFLFNFNARSASLTLECGVYELHGKVKKNLATMEYFYHVNEGTLSEYKFKLNPKEEIQLIPYLDRASKLKAKIGQKITTFEGFFSSVEDIALKVPDPANMRGDDTLLLLKKEKCI